ncbi:MAG: ABC transporter ATP-binding protein [Proteobacteria bacterium]|nr:MAG: ABC transporter ATP-binding protein [Pseudomonadota bacterium]
MTLFTKFQNAMKSSFQHTPQSFHLAWKSSPPIASIIMVFTLASSILPLAIAYVGKLIIDNIVAQNHELTMKWVLVELGLIVGQAFLQRGLFLSRSLLGARLGADVNIMILEKAITLDLSHFEDSEFYDKLTRARREASSRPLSMVTDTLQLVQNVLTLASYVALLFAFSAWAVLGLVIAALPATIVEMRFSKAAFRLRNWRSPETRKLNYIEYVLANDDHVKEVKVLGLGRLLMDRYKELTEKFYKEDKTLSVKRSGWAYLLSLLATFTFYACYMIMALQAADGKLSLGNLTLYVIAFRQGQQAFQSCLTAIGGMYEHNLYMSNLFQFLKIPLKQPLKSFPASTQKAESGIRFEHVGFRYPGRETYALHDINLFIPAGKSLALVGHNGAGKSTFIKLICGLYEPTEGRILLDGRDLRDWASTDLQRRIGVIFQDFNQYHFSLGENIGLGSVDHLDELARINRAVDRVGADEILKGMNEGLDTMLGKWFANGVELSGGQWQKIALARAFVREEADILILDEPTAALDAEAEQKIFERFQQLAKGRTTILISHRFPTVRIADHIVVIEQGQIVEEGRHEILLQKKGRYAELFNLQAKGYL